MSVPTVSRPSVAQQGTFDELGTPLRETTFVVVDLETTGGSPAAGSRITEIGAVKVRAGQRLGEFQTLVDPGCPMPPFVAVLTGITPEMRAYREELFGPVAVVYSVNSDEEALTLANDSDYGLGGAVFSTDTKRAEKVAQRLESGMSNVNTPANEGQEVPFGGVKRSGFGRELGPLGMDEFVNNRLYYVAD